MLKAGDSVSLQSKGKVCFAWEDKTNSPLWNKGANLLNAHCKIYGFPMSGVPLPLTHSIAYIGAVWLPLHCPVGTGSWGTGTNVDTLVTPIAMSNRVLYL